MAQAVLRTKLILLAAPPVLMASTYVVFRAAIASLGGKWGYLAAFVFYWSVWCSLFPLAVHGVGSVGGLFRNQRPSRWALLLDGRSRNRRRDHRVANTLRFRGVAVAWNLLANLSRRSVARISVSGVGLQCLAFVPPSFRGDWRVIVPAAAYLGLLYGWILRRTGLILWTTAFHSLTDLNGLIGVFYLDGR
jgi:hypothetical protein